MSKPSRLKFQQLFDEISGIKAIERQIEIYNRSHKLSLLSAQSLSGEGTFTAAREGCINFRLERMDNGISANCDRILARAKIASNLVGVLGLVVIIVVGYNLWIKDDPLLIFYSLAFFALETYSYLKKCKKRQAENGRMRTAEFLLWLLLPREGREAAIGDTNENFEMMVERFGPDKARLWYWGEVAKSAWPLCCCLGKQLGKWCGIGALVEFLRRAL